MSEKVAAKEKSSKPTPKRKKTDQPKSTKDGWVHIGGNAYMKRN